MSKKHRHSRPHHHPQGRKPPQGGARSRRPHSPGKGHLPGGVEKLGIVHVHERGFGFFIPQDGSPDAFLPPHEVRDVMHGDTVKALVAPDRYKEGKLSARVLSIVKRGRQSLVGILFREHGQTLLKPSDPRLNVTMRLLPGKGGLHPGQAAVARITSWPAPGRPLQGQVVEVLGDPAKPGVDMRMVIRKHDWPERFSAASEAEAARFPANPGAQDLRGRKDLRGLPLLTIDGRDSKDFDDAVSLERTRQGYRLGVHIADVSHYVREGGALDLEARERATSLYLPDRCLPMLPARLSDGLCSLNEGVPRLAVSVFLQFPFDSGVPTGAEFHLSVIQSRRRGIYEEVQQVLDGRADAKVRERYAPLEPMLRDLDSLARLVRAQREKRGAVDFDFPEVTAVLDAEGRTIDVRKRERLGSHRLIEDFMIAANEAVATLLTGRRAPALYRVHEAPSPQDQEELVGVLKAYRVPFQPGSLTKPQGLQALLRSLRGGPLEPLVSYMALRSLNLAVYSTRNLGHFGLASESYAHFTSPIRRYPDLVVHRALKSAMEWAPPAHFAGPTLERLAIHCSDRERLAETADREAERLKQVQFMRDKVGRVYDGVVAGFNPTGAFVELLPHGLEGFLPLANFRGDKPVYDADNRVLRGKHSTARLGDPLRVRVEDVDLAAQRVTLGTA